MKKILLITIILLFQSFPSYGNPQGKGLICKCVNNCSLKLEQNYKSIYFYKNTSVSNNNFYLSNYRFKNDKVYETVSNGSFETDYDNIYLHVEFNNKKTLEYKILRKELIMIHNLEHIKYKCEILNGKERIKRLKLLKQLLQHEYNKKLIDNKI